MDPTTEEKFELHADTAKQFKLVAGAPHIFENRTQGIIDIRTVTVAVVEALIKAGCNYFMAHEHKEPKKEIPAVVSK